MALALTSVAIAAALLSASSADAGDKDVIAMCYAGKDRLDCAADQSERHALIYCNTLCRYWQSNKADRDACHEVWRCTNGGWAAVASQDHRIMSTVCGAASVTAARKAVHDQCPSCSMIETFRIGGTRTDPETAATQSLGERLLEAARRFQGVAYRHPDAGDPDALVCTDLVLKAATEIGLHPPAQAPPDGGTITTSWFKDGMGPEFVPVPVQGRTAAVTLATLATEIAEHKLNVPIGALVVSDGHVALFTGVEKDRDGHWRLLTFDANGRDSLVGEHRSITHWRGDRLVKVFKPVGPSAAVEN